jgi:hypothetical protein
MEKNDSVGEILIILLYFAIIFGGSIIKKLKKGLTAKSGRKPSIQAAAPRRKFEPAVENHCYSVDDDIMPSQAQPDFAAEGISAVQQSTPSQDSTTKPQAAVRRSGARRALRQALVWHEILSTKFPSDSISITQTIKH